MDFIVDVKRIVEIVDEFLKIPSSISYEKPFLNYLNNKISLNTNYEIIQENDYLVVRYKSDNSKVRYLFSAHIDRHGFIQNENLEIEYLGNYLKKKMNILFNSDKIYDDEIKLFNELSTNIEGYDFSYNDKSISFKIRENLSLKYHRASGIVFFETLGIRHANENVSLYDENTGEIIERYKAIRYNIDFEDKLVTYVLDKKVDKKVNDEANIFMFESSCFFDEKYLSGQLDNVISVAVLYYLIENNLIKDEIIFTTKEEIGLSYRCVIDYIEKYNKKELKIIVLDTSPYENFKGKKDGFLVLRKGDTKGMFENCLVEKLESFLKEKNIEYVYKPSDMGITELGAIVLETDNAYNGITLQIPSINYHTTYETVSVKSLENYVKAVYLLSDTNSDN